MEMDTQGQTATGTDTPRPRRRRTGFGEIEKLPSGRYRVRWTEPGGGQRQTARQTFRTLADARGLLATVEADILRKTYRAPRRVEDTVSSYGTRWIERRPGLKDSTRLQYALDFRRHIAPRIGSVQLDELEPAAVREWHADLSYDLRRSLAPTASSGAGRRDGSSTAARAYRLLRSILQTAVDDELLIRNPCRLRGAGDPRSAERPTLSMTEVLTLAAEVGAGYRAFVLMAGFSGLRAGELAALRVRDLVLTGPAPTVSVTRRFYRVGGVMTIEEPKSRAGHRVVPLPAFLAKEISGHLARFRPGAGRDELVFVTASGRDVLDGYRCCAGRWTGWAGRIAGRTTCGTRR